MVKCSLEKLAYMDYSEKLSRVLLGVSKPAQYIGGELYSVCKEYTQVQVRFGFCFPDMYEIGMSHLGMKILYGLINDVPGFACERVFAPAPDMEVVMRENDILLYGLESLSPVRDFDFIGFTLQYEMSYTGVLNMLDLAGLPVMAKLRGDDCPVVIAGGPCACNPEPLCDFIDLFVIGEGEEVTLELLGLYNEMRVSGEYSKAAFLLRACVIPGVYVPSLYEAAYNADGTVAAVTPTQPGVPPRVRKRIISDLDSVYYPDRFVMPFVEIVHDRASTEVLRGCIRGCRFCQAGFIYRPFREKSADTVKSESRVLCETTGYEELSLISLSTSDHSDIENILSTLQGFTNDRRINLSLPSMRIDKFSEEILNSVKSVRKSGLTFAPEAGTQRLRDVINKNISREEILDGCRIAFEGGYSTLKLYFMLGLPTETDEDILGIDTLVREILALYRAGRHKKRLMVSVSLSTFIPKPFTPFQYEPQADKDEISSRQQLLLSHLRNGGVRTSWSDYSTAVVEAALARGDRRLGRVIYEAFKNGSKLDGWNEHYNFDNWVRAFDKCGLSLEFYANRRRSYDEVLPWSHIDVFVSEEFLISENKRAYAGEVTRDCRTACAVCGAEAVCGLH